MNSSLDRPVWGAEAIGKILHTGHGNTDDTASWSVPTDVEKVVEYLDPKNSGNGQTSGSGIVSPAISE